MIEGGTLHLHMAQAFGCQSQIMDCVCEAQRLVLLLAAEPVRPLDLVREALTDHDKPAPYSLDRIVDALPRPLTFLEVRTRPGRVEQRIVQALKEQGIAQYAKEAHHALIEVVENFHGRGWFGEQERGSACKWLTVAGMRSHLHEQGKQPGNQATLTAKPDHRCFHCSSSSAHTTLLASASALINGGSSTLPNNAGCCCLAASACTTRGLSHSTSVLGRPPCEYTWCVTYCQWASREKYKGWA